MAGVPRGGVGRHGPAQGDRLTGKGLRLGWGSRGKGFGGCSKGAGEDGICQEGSLWVEAAQAVLDAESRSSSSDGGSGK